MSTLRSRARIALAGILLAVASLSGCSAAPAALEDSAATTLQAGVLAVTTQAAAGDFAAAQSALDTVQSDLLAAADAGQVTAERSARIQSAINLVTADLAAAVRASTPTPVVTPPADSGTGPGDGKCKKEDGCGEDGHHDRNDDGSRDGSDHGDGSDHDDGN